MLLAQFERGAHVADLSLPPYFGRLRHAATWWTQLCIELWVGGVHRKLDQIDMRFDQSFEFLATRRCWSKHAAVCVHPNARTAFLRVLDHLDHVWVEHRLAAARAAHPRVVLAPLARDAFPEFHGEEIAVTLAVKFADLRVAVGVRAHWAAEVARVDDGHHHHQWKLLGPRPQAIVIACLSVHCHSYPQITQITQMKSVQSVD